MRFTSAPLIRGVIAAIGVAMCLAPSAASSTAPGENAACPPAGWNVDSLSKLREAKFEVTDPSARDQLALNLMPCLASPDPVLRDQITFEAYSRWLRSEQLSSAARRTILASELEILNSERDESGFARPFAALALSELARADARKAFMSQAQRDQLVSSATHYVASVSDYRGFHLTEGWRHGVAHGADLLMQLARHPGVTKVQLDGILQAVAAQVAPASGHFYVYGEPARLVRPVIFVAARGLHAEDAWRAWLERIAAPAPFATWAEAYGNQRGLAKIHNTRAFLQALYVATRESDNPHLQRLLPALTRGMASID